MGNSNTCHMCTQYDDTAIVERDESMLIVTHENKYGCGDGQTTDVTAQDDCYGYGPIYAV